MENSDKVKQRFELLKMARELLNEDYINRRAEDHNKWVAENEKLWRTQRRNLPYPPFVAYPTDEEIVRTASNLYNFIYQDTTETQDTTEEPSEILPESPTMEISEGDFVFPQPIVEEPAVDPSPEEIIEETVEHVAEEVKDIAEPDYKPVTVEDIKFMEAKVAAAPKSTLLPGWIRRTIGQS